MNIKQLVMNILKNNTNPVMKNLIDMAEKGEVEKLKNFGRNLYNDKGKDFDKELENFQKNFGIK